MDKFEADQAGVPPPPRAERSHKCGELADLVAERVEKSQGRISAKRSLPIAVAAGYEGSDRNFRRLVADAKRSGTARITVAAARRCGRQENIWSSTGPKANQDCFCSAQCWRSLAGGSSASPATSARRPR